MKVYALALLVVLTAAVGYHYNALVDERDGLKKDLSTAQGNVRRLDWNQ